MSIAEQVFNKFAQRGRGMGMGAGRGTGRGGGRFFAKGEVERVMTHYNVNEEEAYKMMADGTAKLPPVGSRRGR